MNFCFFFAPAFHPAFKAIMPVRQQLAGKGVRTIFNLLGPLINPGQPAHQLLGVFSDQWVSPLAKALDALDLHSGLVVHGSPEPGRALDELSCAGTNTISGFGTLSSQSGNLSAIDGGLEACNFSDLKGGDVEKNMQILSLLLNGGSVPTGLRNTVLLNAGAAFWVAGRAGDLKEGVTQARALIEEGTVQNWLERVQAFYA